MNKKIKIIFCDIDWTLFDHSKNPSRFDKRSIKYLSKLQKEGVLVFLSTARPYHSVKRIKILDLFTPDGMILANGGLIIYKDEIIYNPLMKEDDFISLCELTNKYGGNLEGIRPYDCFLINNNIEVAKKLFDTYPEDIPPIEDYHHQKVIGVNLFISKEYDEKIKSKLPKVLYYYRYHDYGVDVASVPHIKGEAVKFVLDYLKIDKESACSIGDDHQDISMFKETNYSIAMGNGKEEVKDNAKHITKTVTKHGVKYILKKLM